ncbi:MAG: hypothetical protein M3P22_01460 [bacterium]|nr:hypothetical protein [bacterium]
MNSETTKRLIVGFLSYILLYLIILVVLILILFLIFYSVYEIEFESTDFWILILIEILASSGFLMNRLKETKPNECDAYQGIISGKIYLCWPGTNWVSPLQRFFRNVDIIKNLETFDSEISSAKDDDMSYTWRTLYIVNTENDRDKNMRKFIKTTEAYIAASIKISNDLKTSTWLASHISEDAKKTQEEALDKRVLENECEEYGIRIKKNALTDLDFSKETDEARKTIRKMKAFQDSVNELMKGTNAPEDIKAAHRIVKAQMLANYREYEFTGDSDVKKTILVKE